MDPDGSCKVSKILVSSTPPLTEVLGFQTVCRPDGSCKVSRVLVSSTPRPTDIWGFRSGCRWVLMDHVKSQGFWFLLLRSSRKFGGSEPGVDLMDHVKIQGRSSQKFWGSEPGVDLMDHVKSRGFWFLLLHHSQKFGGFKPGVNLMDHVKS